MNIVHAGEPMKKRIFKRLANDSSKENYRPNLLKKINIFMIFISFLSTTFFRIGSAGFFACLVFFLAMVACRFCFARFDNSLLTILILYGSSTIIVGIAFFTYASFNLSYLIIILIASGIITNKKFITILFIYDCFLMFLMTVFGDFYFFSKEGVSEPLHQIFPVLALLLMGFCFSISVVNEIAILLTKIIESDKLYHETLAGITDGVISINRDKKIILANDMALKILNCDIKEIKRQNIKDVIILESVKQGQNIQLTDILREDLNSHSFIQHDNYELLIGQDSKIAIEFSFSILHDKNSLQKGYLFIFRDITEHKRLEAEFIKTQKIESIALLAGGIAHDFNNILGTIQGNVSILEFDLLDQGTTEITQTFLDISKGINRATRLTHQLLTFAKGGSPNKCQCNIIQLIKDSCEFSLHGSNIILDLDSPDDIWDVCVDSDQISQVIQNFAMNSIQATPRDNQIHISVKNEYYTVNKWNLEAGAYIIIEFLDYGNGISAENITKIFDPYFTTKSTGTGLGLAVCYSIIARHEGLIEVSSVENKFTRFTIHLPASPNSLVEHKSPEKLNLLQNQAAIGAKILVLEDDDLLHYSISKMLKRLGCKSEICSDGSQLIKLYSSEMKRGGRYDAVLLDLTVPGGMGGLETINNLIEINPNVIAIASSGYSTSNISHNYYDYGFSAFLNKPYTISEMNDVLHEVLPSINVISHK